MALYWGVLHQGVDCINYFVIIYWNAPKLNYSLSSWVYVALYSVNFYRLEFNRRGKTTERHKKRCTLLELVEVYSLITLLRAPSAVRTPIVVLTA